MPRLPGSLGEPHQGSYPDLKLNQGAKELGIQEVDSLTLTVCLALRRPLVKHPQDCPLPQRAMCALSAVVCNPVSKEV